MSRRKRGAPRQQRPRDLRRPVGRGWRPGRRALSTILGVALVLVAGSIVVFTAGWDTLMGRGSSSTQRGANLRVAPRIDATGRLLLTLDGGLSLVSLPDR